MGASSSTEVRAAQQTIRKLTKELDVARKAAPTVEKRSSAPTTFIQPKMSAPPKEQLAVHRLEDALRSERKEAANQRGEAQRAAQELRKARDELEQIAGQRKYELLEKKKAKGAGLEANITAASLVAEASEALAVAESLEDENSHPVFGELLFDFGHKKIYRSKPTRLWPATVLWQKQRAFRDDRVAMIARAKKASKVGGWPGAVSMVETEDVPVVVDGQHRLGAAWLLSQQKGGLPDSLSEMVVEVYPKMAEAAVAELFAEINKAEPLALIDMPDITEDSGDNRRASITSAAEELRTDFNSMFKPSRACRAPHLNIDALRDELFKAGPKFNEHAELIAWLKRRDRELAALTREEWVSKVGRSRATNAAALDKALEKAIANDFYLGMTWEWLYVNEEEA